MELRSRVIDIPANMVVLHIAGRITTSNLAPLEAELKQLTSGGPVKLIMDLQNVTGLDSQGVGALIQARNDIIGRGGQVVLMGATQRILSVLRISGLDSYFPMAPTEFQAIKLLQ